MGFLEASAKSGGAADEECEQAWFFSGFSWESVQDDLKAGSKWRCPKYGQKKSKAWFFLGSRNLGQA